LHDMLSHGEALLRSCYTNWPESLPVLLIHGTEDKITSSSATVTFHDRIQANEKKILLYKGGFHELQNEPNGVKEKLANDVILFIEANLSRVTTTGEERSKL